MHKRDRIVSGKESIVEVCGNFMHNYPFEIGEKIGDGENRGVFRSIHDSVIKVFKGGEQVLIDSTIDNNSAQYSEEDLERLIRQVEQDQAQLERIRKLLQAAGDSKDIVPKSEYIIHTSPSNELTFSEVQPEVKQGRTLNENKLNIFKLSKNSLLQLLHLLEVNKSLLKQKEGLDLVGRSKNNNTIAYKVLARLLPIFFSNNIMISQNQEVRYVNAKIFEKQYYEHHKGSGGNLNILISLAGTYISQAILKSMLMFKK